MEFLFAPSTAATRSSTQLAPFDPATATFAEHLQYNIWGWYNSRQQELISRTGLLALLVVSETIVSTWGTLAGVELVGAAGWAGIWGFGTVVLGAVLDWVGGPSD